MGTLESDRLGLIPCFVQRGIPDDGQLTCSTHSCICLSCNLAASRGPWKHVWPVPTLGQGNGLWRPSNLCGLGTILSGLPCSKQILTIALAYDISKEKTGHTHPKSADIQSHRLFPVISPQTRPGGHPAAWAHVCKDVGVFVYATWVCTCMLIYVCYYVFICIGFVCASVFMNFFV